MPFFIVTMTHPDEEGWRRQLGAHVDYLRDLVDRGSLRASGPLKDMPTRAGFLIFKADDRGAVEALVRADPFSLHRLIGTLTIAEWDPLFGAFAAESSGALPELDRAGAADRSPHVPS